MPEILKITCCWPVMSHTGPHPSNIRSWPCLREAMESHDAWRLAFEQASSSERLTLLGFPPLKEEEMLK